MYNQNNNNTIHQLFPTRTEQECLAELRKHPRSYFAYQNMSPEWKNRFLGFMEGKKTLPLTYDPFFKKLFNPDIYPERLSSLISSIIGTRVTVQCILSNEDSMLPSPRSCFWISLSSWKMARSQMSRSRKFHTLFRVNVCPATPPISCCVSIQE